MSSAAILMRITGQSRLLPRSVLSR